VHRSYEIGAVLFGVRTNSPAFGEWLGRNLARYETSAELQPYYSAFVADDHLPGKRFHVLYADTRPIVRTASLATLGLALVRELETLLFHGRDDAAYAMTPLLSADGVHGAMPPGTVPLIATLGRQVERAGVVLPLEPAVAIDLDSALATPIRPLLGVPDDAFASLSKSGAGSERALVERPLPIDVLFSIGSSDEPLQPVSKGVALYRLAHYAANLPRVGRRGFEAFGRVVAAADCVEVRADTRRVMLDSIVTALRERAEGRGDGGHPA
jgi:hypothetical protein